MTDYRNLVQRENKFRLEVTFPADYQNYPRFAGTTRSFFFRSYEMAEQMRRNFRALGAIC